MQKKDRQARCPVAAWLAFSWLLLPAAVLAREPAYEVEIKADVKVPMRDGANLSANVFLPKARGSVPVILARTPYGKGPAQGGIGS